VRGEAFNFSPQRPLTVLEITRAVLAAMDRSDLEPVILNSARGETRDQYLDRGKAARVLGWEPRFTLEEGLEATVAWYRTFLRCEP
jgi:CDP-glucose 4,6-dehydratase